MPRASIRHRAARARASGSSLHAQAAGIVVVDFLHLGTVLLRRLHVLVFIEHDTRRIQLGGITANPTGEWTMQQARNLALSLGERFEDIKFLIRDRESTFTASFDAVFQAADTRILRTARPGAAHECDLRAPCRYPAPRTPRPHADPRRAPPALRPDGIPGALQHGQAAPRYRPPTASPTANTTVATSPLPTSTANGSTETRPQRPDQRIHARRLTPRRLTGHQADPIFERDRLAHRRGVASDGTGSPGSYVVTMVPPPRRSLMITAPAAARAAPDVRRVHPDIARTRPAGQHGPVRGAGRQAILGCPQRRSSRCRIS
jgi:hypothetical protein